VTWVLGKKYLEGKVKGEFETIQTKFKIEFPNLDKLPLPPSLFQLLFCTQSLGDVSSNTECCEDNGDKPMVKVVFKNIKLFRRGNFGVENI